MQPTTETETLPAEAIAFACGTAPPVLQTEDGAAFARMLEGIRRDVEPRGLLEEMYVGDIACIIWVVSAPLPRGAHQRRIPRCRGGDRPGDDGMVGRRDRRARRPARGGSGPALVLRS